MNVAGPEKSRLRRAGTKTATLLPQMADALIPVTWWEERIGHATGWVVVIDPPT